ncbi:branched-chain-amino-acid aminotransferase, cytosolic-like, partial [Paramuricea clavata]
MAFSLRTLSRLSLKSVVPRHCASTVSKVLPRCMSSMSDIKHDNLKVTKCSTPKDKPTDIGNIEFGAAFTDHMLTIQWSIHNGWENPEIKPYGNISLSPAAKVLHYAVEGFEGMKAYFDSSDGSIRLFRPMENVLRLQRTAERMCLPKFDGDEFLKCLMELVKVDKDWVPKEDSCSLYLRPTFIGTGPTLGVSEANEALLYCILSPVGPYFKTGSFKPVSLMADSRFVRSWHGGCGDSKAGGNYAPTLFAQAEARKRNCEQVLWLYGEDQQITEVGTMNLFIYLENENGEEELVTPPLDGLILPGITRMSMLDLARQW